MHEWSVSSEEAGIKLLAFLVLRLGTLYSAKFLKRVIENNCCKVNGRTERFASTLLGQADHISLLIENAAPSSKLIQLNPSAILYEDADLLVYNKPQEINCDDEGILKLLKGYDSTLQLVHRLDRNTTGALILAKNQQTYLYFVDQFKSLQVQKCYKAIVDGVISNKQGTIDNYLDKKKTYAGQSIWGSVKSGGLRAVTAWAVLKRAQDTTLLRCFPKTGRTHQIRVHLAEMHHPILGDFQYGKTFKCQYRPAHYLLHAEKISFVHPKSAKVISVEAKLSDDFSKAQLQLFGL